jgi:hypothetical protein
VQEEEEEEEGISCQLLVCSPFFFWQQAVLKVFRVLHKGA